MTDLPDWREVVTDMELRFMSGNSIPVERATIKRHEWEAILMKLHDALPVEPSENHPVVATLLSVATRAGTYSYDDMYVTPEEAAALRQAAELLTAAGRIIEPPTDYRNWPREPMHCPTCNCPTSPASKSA